jgi:hypothetical protein
VDIGFGVFVEDELCDAFAIAQVNENHSAQIAAAMDPAHEQGFLAGIGSAQLPAAVRAAEVA